MAEDEPTIQDLLIDHLRRIIEYWGYGSGEGGKREWCCSNQFMHPKPRLRTVKPLNKRALWRKKVFKEECCRQPNPFPFP